MICHISYVTYRMWHMIFVTPYSSSPSAGFFIITRLTQDLSPIYRISNECFNTFCFKSHFNVFKLRFFCFESQLNIFNVQFRFPLSIPCKFLFTSFFIFSIWKFQRRCFQCIFPNYILPSIWSMESNISADS